MIVILDIRREMVDLNRRFGVWARPIRGRTLDADGQEIERHGYAISVGRLRETVVHWVTVTCTDLQAWGKCRAWFAEKELARL